MSEYESSYYEIALTHRQVVVSFVVLLVFVLAVFLCGVWVGKNGADAGVDGNKPEPPRIARNGPDEVPGDLSAVEEYSFDRQDGADGQNLDTPDLSVLDNPTPQTTLAQELGRDETASRELPPPTTQPTTQPPAQAKPEPETSSKKPPPITSDEGPLKPSSTTPAPSPTPAGQEPSSGFVVQVFSGRDQDQAKKVVQALKSDGYKAYLSPVKVGSQMRYRVRIGPYDDRADAEGAERIVRQKYRYETWVTSAEN